MGPGPMGRRGPELMGLRLGQDGRCAHARLAWGRGALDPWDLGRWALGPKPLALGLRPLGSRALGPNWKLGRGQPVPKKTMKNASENNVTRF